MINYPPPDMPIFCIQDVQRIQNTDRYDLHIISYWTNDGPVEVSSETVDFVSERMVFCPPGYPVPPL